MLVGGSFSALAIIDLYCLIKIIKKHKKHKQPIERLLKAQPLNVSELYQLFQAKKVGQKAFVIVKGHMKAKPNRGDNNIYSAIVETPINMQDIIKQYEFDRIPYGKVHEKAWWTRPQKLRNVDFNLNDIWNKSTLNVELGSTSDISGALTEAVKFHIKLQPVRNRLLMALQRLYNRLSKTLPFSLFMSKSKTVHKISYYGLLDSNFAIVVGQACKKPNGEISIENPEYVTKQLSFVIKRLRKQFYKQFFMYKIMFAIFAALQILLLYYLGKWAYQKYKRRLLRLEQDILSSEQQMPDNHSCIICFTHSRSVIFKPCKHYILCLQCYEKLNKSQCPICKQNIEGVIRVIKR